MKHIFPARLLQNRIIERNGEDLIRTAIGISLRIVAVDDVEQITRALVPKFLIERPLGFGGVFGNAIGSPGSRSHPASSKKDDITSELERLGEDEAWQR